MTSELILSLTKFLQPKLFELVNNSFDKTFFELIKEPMVWFPLLILFVTNFIWLFIIGITTGKQVGKTYIRTITLPLFWLIFFGYLLLPFIIIPAFWLGLRLL